MTGRSFTVLGLTGSIGMGKSTTAAMLKDLAIPVHDSDAAVHLLYRGKAAPIVEALFPGTTENGVVDRAALSSRVLGDKAALARLEAAIHPLLRQQEVKFRNASRKAGADIVVLDMPLLFETGGHSRVDGIIVVTASPAEQRRRVLLRPGMNEKKLEAILARQVPDSQKHLAADFIVDTGMGLDQARRQVVAIIDTIRSGRWKPKSN